MARAARFLIAALMCFGIGLWCRQQFRIQQAQELWSGVLGGKAEEILGSKEMPETAENLANRATIRLEHTFPPDRTGIRSDLRAALLRAPLTSGYWLFYAKNELFAGRTEAGRAALQRSDETDPFFPDQLLESIQLWNLLGEHDRGKQIARNVATLGFDYLKKSAGELSQMGVPPVEVFSIASPGELTPKQTGELLNAIESHDAKQLEEIFSAIPGNYFNDHEFQVLAITRASDPFLYDMLSKIWIARNKAATDREGLFVIANEELNDPPFRDVFPLGWQPIPMKGTAGGGWVAPDASNNMQGAIRVLFPRGEWGQKAAASIRYPFYEVPWTGVRGITFHLTARASEGDTPSAWLSTVADDLRIHSNTVKLSTDKSVIDLYVPHLKKGSILEISLNARSTENSPDSQTEIIIEGLQIEADPVRNE